jgi:cardiolipin synthase A/B
VELLLPHWPWLTTVAAFALHLLVSIHIIFTRLMLLDGVWTMLGSANWDARSLRLNFEFNIECYDLSLAASLESHLEKNFVQVERMTLDTLNARPLLIKLRDGVARVLMPYL